MGPKHHSVPHVPSVKTLKISERPMLGRQSAAIGILGRFIVITKTYIAKKLNEYTYWKLGICCRESRLTVDCHSFRTLSTCMISWRHRDFTTRCRSRIYLIFQFRKKSRVSQYRNGLVTSWYNRDKLLNIGHNSLLNSYYRPISSSVQAKLTQRK